VKNNITQLIFVDNYSKLSYLSTWELNIVIKSAYQDTKNRKVTINFVHPDT